MKKKLNYDEFSAKKRAIEHTMNGSNRTFEKIDAFEAATSCAFCKGRYEQFSRHIWQPACNCMKDVKICVVKLEREDKVEG